MKSVCSLKPKTTQDVTQQNTQCFVCKGSVFKVTNITPDLVMMKCKKCSEIHMLSTQEKNKGLLFWDSEELPYY